ncbi:MAG: VacJ family lipoprotein [Alphaproteobacteria bacterium]|nr:VacJ family lipoprotein [Alphaproteobacteria bacterium]
MLTKRCMTLAVVLGVCFSAGVVRADIPVENEDKFEGFNRAMFGFNMTLDEYVLEPLAKGYRAITNQYVRDRVSGVLSNIVEPVSAVNHLLQGDVVKSGQNIGRFALNSTLGLLGMYDVAGGGWHLAPAKTNFDETLATWCVKDGPYLVFPVLGMNTMRSFSGEIVDGFANPLYIATYGDSNINAKVLYPYAGLVMISKREKSIEFIDSFKQSSVDLYAISRSAFLQNRKKMARCGVVEESATPDYDFDFDVEE